MIKPDLLKEFSDMKIKISISFHSHLPEITNAISNNLIAYDKKLETIRFLCKNGTPPHITIVATDMTKDHIIETVRFLCLEGVKGITISHTMDAGFAFDNKDIGMDFWEYANLVEKAKEIAKDYGTKLTCNTNFPFLLKNGDGSNTMKEMADLFYGTIDGRRALYIDYLGDIYPTTYNFGAPNLRLGNIITDNLAGVWDNSQILNDIRTSKPNNQDVCRETVRHQVLKFQRLQDL